VPRVVPNSVRVKNLGILKGSYDMNGENEIITNGIEISVILFKTILPIMAK
jgi:hypothetical protein